MMMILEICLVATQCQPSRVTAIDTLGLNGMHDTELERKAVESDNKIGRVVRPLGIY